MSSQAKQVYSEKELYDKNVKLTDEQVAIAKNELYSERLLELYPAINKYWADPLYQSQNYCLHSFAPTPGAKPDEDGVYGFMKIRGVFSTTEEAEQRAEWLIRNTDSMHSIRTSFVGKPIPLIANKSKYLLEVNEIDIKKKTIDSVSKDIKANKEEDRQEIKTMKEREVDLLAESKRNEEDIPMEPFEKYTQLKVKRAQLIWTYIETQKKMEQMKTSILSTIDEIREADETEPDYSSQYYEHYMKARKDAGIPDDDDSFIKYLSEDLVPEIEWLN